MDYVSLKYSFRLTLTTKFSMPWSIVPCHSLTYTTRCIIFFKDTLTRILCSFYRPWHFGFKYRHITAAGFDDRYEEIRREYVDWCVVAYISIIFFICSFILMQIRDMV